MFLFMSIKKLASIFLTTAIASCQTAFMANIEAEMLLSQNSIQTNAGFRVPDEYLQSVNQL